MKARCEQKGSTLVVSLIMLVLITLVAVSAIRFGVVNLKIAGNAQVQTEATTAAQTTIENLIEEINVAENLDAIQAKAALSVVTGSQSYPVAVVKPACKISVPVLNQELNTASAADIPCFESADSDFAYKPDGTPIGKLSACNRQQWDLEVSVNDASTGASLTMVQGLSVRVPAQVACN
ncbi:hypothetical protein F9Z44_13525 [Hydrogenophaga sp. PBL-H3]|nr:pilus assembly PilX N-terminal domain-containing protein [Hydrogenophaga sp. PBL-H3]QHE76992.1 hypothetical protein F9Z45_13525 [Hydrogenophaga sp. PBL-H3]QHE81416.1 hypothetical protein F9Z44_13525 [Hydrogenophaga sp. PBL-H3]